MSHRLPPAVSPQIRRDQAQDPNRSGSGLRHALGILQRHEDGPALGFDLHTVAFDLRFAIAPP